MVKFLKLKVKSFFPALKNKNYRLYFLGQSISNIGSWIQVVAQGWLVLQLSQSAFWVGFIAALGSLPVMFFSLFGGVIVDRFPKKIIIYITQASAMVLAFTLGISYVLKIISLPEIAIIAFLSGIVNAIDVPARQSYVYDMVGPQDLHSAISLNSAIFNSARIIGPACAGIIIALLGLSGAFMINGLSFLAVIAALYFIHTQETVHNKKLHPLEAIKQGFIYSYQHSVIKTLFMITIITSIFGWSYSAIMPVVAQNVYHQNAAGLGYLFTAIGFGAITTVIVTAVFSKKISKLKFIFIGNVIISIALILFSFTQTVYGAYPVLFLLGFGMLMQMTTINTVIQTLVNPKYRGRIMGIYALCNMGLFPLGSLQIGYLTEHFGALLAIRFAGLMMVGAGILLFIYRKKLSQAYVKHSATAYDIIT